MGEVHPDEECSDRVENRDRQRCYDGSRRGNYNSGMISQPVSNPVGFCLPFIRQLKYCSCFAATLLFDKYESVHTVFRHRCETHTGVVDSSIFRQNFGIRWLCRDLGELSVLAE